jgi:hypothetical protein
LTCFGPRDDFALLHDLPQESMIVAYTLVLNPHRRQLVDHHLGGILLQPL